MANHCGNPECVACTETEQQIKEIYMWLAEIMPAARMAMKMLNARSALASRWRGKKDA